MKKRHCKPIALILALIMTLSLAAVGSVSVSATGSLTVRATSNFFPEGSQTLSDLAPYTDASGDTYIAVEYKLNSNPRYLINIQCEITWDPTQLEYKEAYNTVGEDEGAPTLNLFPFAVSQNRGSGVTNTFEDSNYGKVTGNFSSVTSPAYAYEEDGSDITAVRAVFKLLDASAGEVVVDCNVNALSFCDESEATPYAKYKAIDEYVENAEAKAVAQYNTAVDFVEQETTVYDEALTYDSRYATFLDAIEMTYRVPAASLDGYTDPVLLVTNLDDAGSETQEIQGELNTNTNYHEFKFKVPPSMIVDNKSLVVRATRSSDGKTVEGPLKEDSVYRYVNQALVIYEPYADNDGYKELMSLMVDTLNYAASVQKYIPRRTDKLANDTVAPYQKYSLTGNFTPVDENYYTGTMTSGATYKVIATAVKFDSNITPQFYIGAAEGVDKTTLRWTNDVYLEVKLNNDVYRYETPVSEYINAGSYEYSIFEFNELMANQLGREIFVTVRDKSTNDAVSDTYHYTVNSYLPKYLSQVQNPDAKAVALLTAMGRYGESAKEYALKQHLIG